LSSPSVQVEKRQASALAVDLIERTAQGVGIPVQSKRFRQARADGRRDSPGRDQAVQLSAAGDGPQLRHRLVVIGDEESLPLLDTTQVPAQVLSQLGDADGGLVTIGSRC